MHAPPDPKRELQKVNDWNSQYQVGQKVTVVKDNNEVLNTVTTSRAYMLGACGDFPGHTPVIMVEGISGCYHLDRVKAVSS